MELRSLPRISPSSARAWSNFDSGIHAVVVLIIVACATGLRILHDLDVNTTGAIFAGGLGYAAGRSGSSGRVRQSDPVELRNQLPD